MKKRCNIFLMLFALIALVGCNSEEGFSLNPNGGGIEIISKEPPLKTTDTKHCEDCKIKMWEGESSSANFYITPVNFEYDRLEEKGYRMEISVSYDVYYVKDYNAIGNIGYAGAPKYEVAIYNSDDLGVFENDITTPKNKERRSIEYRSEIANLRNTRIILKFSTDNIQNTIHFQNIVVDYNCY